MPILLAMPWASSSCKVASAFVLIVSPVFDGVFAQPILPRNASHAAVAEEVAQMLLAACQQAAPGSRLSLELREVVELLHSAPAQVSPSVRQSGRAFPAPLLARSVVCSGPHADGQGGSNLSSQPASFPWGPLCVCMGLWLLIHVCSHWAPAAIVMLSIACWVDSQKLRPLGRNRGRWRHGARSQVYNIGAVVGGIALASEYTSRASLDQHFTWRHRAAFTVAMSHWLTTFIEDMVFPPRMLRLQLLCYRLHHLCAALIYAVLLHTRRMSAVGVGGLIFELPVIGETVLRALRVRCIHALPPARLASLWDATLSAAALGRGVPLLVYFHAMLFWQEERRDVPVLWFWDTAFVLFLLLTVGWYCMLLLQRARDLGSAEHHIAGAGREPTEREVDTIALGVAANPGAPAAERYGQPVESCDERRVDVAPGARNVTSAELQQHRTRSSCWVVMRGVVYDVTAFLDQHPGGPGRLLRNAGVDCAPSFEAVGHSRAAYTMLERMRVGCLNASLHPAESPPAPANGCGAAASAARGRAGWGGPYNPVYPPNGVGTDAQALGIALAASTCILILRLLPAPSSACLDKALIGLGLAAGCGAMASVRMLRHGEPGFPPWDVSIIPCGCGLTVLAVVVQACCFRALALGSGVALLLSAGGLPPPCAGGPSAGDGACCSRTRWVWILFAAYVVPTHGTEDVAYMKFVFDAVASAAAILALCWRCPSSNDHPLLPGFALSVGTLAVAAICAATLWAMVRLGLTTELGFIGLDTALVGDPASRLTFLAELHWYTALDVVASTCSAAACCVLACSARTLSRRHSPCLAAAWLSLSLGFPSAWAQLSHVSGILALWGWQWQLRKLAAYVESMATHAAVGTPSHYARIQSVLDLVRGHFALVLWYLLARPLEALVSWLLPTDLRVYACESPVCDMGGRLHVGVCFVMPGAQKEPGYLVCNVGHIPGSHWNDARATVTATLDIMNELDAGVPGFVSNILCVVPEYRPNRSSLEVAWTWMREINISLWESPEAARDWHAASQAHASILQKHQNGHLHVFSDLLMSWVPQAVSWERRCVCCKRPAAGLSTDTCPKCGGKTIPIPAF